MQHRNWGVYTVLSVNNILHSNDSTSLRFLMK